MGQSLDRFAVNLRVSLVGLLKGQSFFIESEGSFVHGNEQSVGVDQIRRNSVSALHDRGKLEDHIVVPDQNFLRPGAADLIGLQRIVAKPPQNLILGIVQHPVSAAQRRIRIGGGGFRIVLQQSRSFKQSQRSAGRGSNDDIPRRQDLDAVGIVSRLIGRPKDLSLGIGDHLRLSLGCTGGHQNHVAEDRILPVFQACDVADSHVMGPDHGVVQIVSGLQLIEVIDQNVLIVLIPCQEQIIHHVGRLPNLLFRRSGGSGGAFRIGRGRGVLRLGIGRRRGILRLRIGNGGGILRHRSGNGSGRARKGLVGPRRLRPAGGNRQNQRKQ